MREVSATGPEGEETSGAITSSIDGAADMGSSLGRYVVLEEVGRGGMGRVLRAYDPKLQREVALKVLRASRLGEEGARRLVAEARAMAKLSHANVVAVYDVEELTHQRLVLVMEYVAGATLHTWLGARRHRWREIVTCFRQAGRGLAAAHEVGLLHRDFKPANVLVAGETVKVTDFGLAKAEPDWESEAEASLGSSPSPDDMSRTGTVLGTPRYMAPEQHQGRALTTAVDQYAFCVALWEALLGAPPFSSDDLRLLVEQKLAGPPAWTSTSLPVAIGEVVRRGLSADPERRWPSMAALLDALAHDPAKRRNRWLLVAASLGVSGLAGAGWRSWEAARAERCSGAEAQLEGVWDQTRRREVHAALVGVGVSYAKAVANRTAAVLDRYATDWSAMRTRACEATTIRGEQSTKVMDLRMACLHRARMELVAVTQVLADADADVARNADTLVSGLAQLERCADVEALQASVEPPPAAEAEAVEDIRQLLAEAAAERESARFDEAQSKLERAKRRLEGVEYEPARTEVLLEEGYLHQGLGSYDAAEAALREALLVGSRWRQWDTVRDAASSLMLIVGERKGRIEEGLRYRELALGLAVDNPRAQARVRNNLALVLLAQGQYAKAEAECRRVLTLLTQTLGPEHPNIAMARNNLGGTLTKQGKYAAAEAEFRKALVRLEREYGADHPAAAMSRHNLAGAMVAQGEYDEAEEEYRRTLALRVKTLGADHPDVTMSRHDLAGVLYAQKRYGLAEAEFRRALAQYEKRLGPETPQAMVARRNVAVVLQAQGKHAEAEAEYRAALAICERVLGADHPEVAGVQTNLADVLLERGQIDEALRLAEQAWARQQRSDIAPKERATTAFVLARTLWSSERARARTLAQRAIDGYVRAGDGYQDDAAEVRAWLDVRARR